MLEFVVVAVVAVLGFGAIAFRFMPRDARGARRLPKVVNQSIGMYAIRRFSRPRRSTPQKALPIAIEPTGEAAHQLSAPGTPDPTVPTRFVVSRGTHQAHPMSEPVPTMPVVGRSSDLRSRRRPAGAVARERRIAGLVAVGVVAIAVLGVALMPRGSQGAVLSATTAPSQSPPADPGLASAAPSATASPSPTPSPTPLITEEPTLAPTPTASPTPSPTPTRTPRPTPTRTPKPTVKPPTPSPTAAPTPSPTVAPPSASPPPPSESPPPPSASPSTAP